MNVLEATIFLKAAFEKIAETMNVEVLDEETVGMAWKIANPMVSTKRVNLRIRRLEMKRREISGLAC